MQPQVACEARQKGLEQMEQVFVFMSWGLNGLFVLRVQGASTLEKGWDAGIRKDASFDFRPYCMASQCLAVCGKSEASAQLPRPLGGSTRYPPKRVPGNYPIVA